MAKRGRPKKDGPGKVRIQLAVDQESAQIFEDLRLIMDTTKVDAFNKAIRFLRDNTDLYQNECEFEGFEEEDL